MSKKNSKKSQAAQERRNKKMEEQGKSVIRWIAITLGVLFIALMGYFAVLGS